MGSGLSEDEFHRMQLQLLELRTTNYKFQEKCQRQERELEGLRGQVGTLEKDLQKANRALNKSKKAKECEQMLQENDVLQHKLHSQEEEFRLQNETLMKELGQVITQNENFEKENSQLRTGVSVGSQQDVQTQALQDELRRVQATNMALQKNLNEHQSLHEEEVGSLRQTLADLDTQCLKLSGQRGTPVGAGSSESRTIEGQSDQDSACEDMTDSQAQPRVDDGNGHEMDITSDIFHLVTKPSINSDQELPQKLVNDLRLSLDTEREEKKLLKQQLQNIEKEHKDQIQTSRVENNKLMEKLKKKQECLLQLQEEKEKLYTELSCRLEEAEMSKSTELHLLQEHSGRLQDELGLCNKELEDYEGKSNLRIHELQDLVDSLEARVNEAGLESTERLSEQNQQFQQQLGEFQMQLVAAHRQIGDMQTQIKEIQNAHQEALAEIQAAKQERERQLQAAEEAQKLAEKRKSLLDDLAIRYQEDSDQHRDSLRQADERHIKEVEELQEQLDDLKLSAVELERCQQEMAQLKANTTSVEEAKGWLERRLSEVEEGLEQTKQRHSSELLQRQEEHDTHVSSLSAEHTLDVRRLEEKLLQTEIDKEELQNQIDQLKQDVKDNIDEKKIHEKKGVTMLKDLKRQLQAERKRADKLQERLQELLSADTRSRQSVEELFRPVDQSDRYKGDNSSISSWSLGGLSRDNTAVTTPEDDMQAGQLEAENSDLMKRLGEIQQEKWMLEEKVSHLESSNSCMAEDLLQKSCIIEHYVMDSRLESAQSPGQEKSLSLQKVMQFMKERGDDSQRDMNKKLQNMLEETLTKNMHLQQNLETLSNEVVRLSKLAVHSMAPPVSH